jgi:hypothetical protein
MEREMRKDMEETTVNTKAAEAGDPRLIGPKKWCHAPTR